MEAGILGGMLVGFAVMAVVGLLVGGLFLKLSVRLIGGFSTGYGKSILVVLLSNIAVFAVAFLIGLVMGASGMSAGAMQAGDVSAAGMIGTQLVMMGVQLVLALVFNALFINLLIKQPDGRAIGFGKSLLIALVYLIALFVVIFVLSFVLALVLGVGAGMAAGM